MIAVLTSFSVIRLLQDKMQKISIQTTQMTRQVAVCVAVLDVQTCKIQTRNAGFKTCDVRFKLTADTRAR